jgi:hypothetical protein
MAATTAAAVKAYLEGLGLGVPVFRDEAPAKQSLPYITVREDVANVPDLDGDQGDPDAEHTTAETVQVDLWQTWRNPQTAAVVESYTLPKQIQRALRGAHLDVSPTHTYGVVLTSTVRLLERASNVVHHASTAVVRRVL